MTQSFDKKKLIKVFETKPVCTRQINLCEKLVILKNLCRSFVTPKNCNYFYNNLVERQQTIARAGENEDFDLIKLIES